MIAIASDEPDDIKVSTMEARLLLRSVFHTTEDELLKQLNAVQEGRECARALRPHDVQVFLRDLCSFTSLCIEHHLPLGYLYGYMDGGAVTNDSYQYWSKPHSTQVHVDGTQIRIGRHPGRWLTHTKGICEIGYKPIDIPIEDKVRDLGWVPIRGVRGCWRP